VGDIWVLEKYVNVYKLFKVLVLSGIMPSPT